MGNFSVSHYARIEVAASGAEIRYVLDLAEIPSFQLLQQWGLNADSPRNLLDAKAEAQAREWVRNLASHAMAAPSRRVSRAPRWSSRRARAALP